MVILLKLNNKEKTFCIVVIPSLINATSNTFFLLGKRKIGGIEGRKGVEMGRGRCETKLHMISWQVQSPPSSLSSFA